MGKRRELNPLPEAFEHIATGDADFDASLALAGVISSILSPTTRESAQTKLLGLALCAWPDPETSKRIAALAAAFGTPTQAVADALQ